jgi:putative FmdB family regulatory protein
MKYDFFCKPCNAVDEIERKMSEATLPYHCPECKAECRRIYSAPNVVTKGEDIAVFNPAFGEAVTDAQAKRMAKQRGWIEIGNEDINKYTPPPQRQELDADDYFL